jgi:prepilin-type N-terminal cleavage/methylation domain-containing protein
MRTTTGSRPAFTLIECMIATALGSVLAYTAFAGFRVASQGVSVANRMSLENGLIRAGYFSALDEADHWRQFDNPDDPGRQRLRGFVESSGRGLPFTPFPRRFPLRENLDADAENDRGWDPDYCWPANDPRIWFHGNLAERYRSKATFGHYELFAHYEDSPVLEVPLAFNANAIGVPPPYGATDPTRTHTWFFNQLEGLRNTLGYYGVCEYMPSSTCFAVYGSSNAAARSTGRDQGYQAEWLELAGGTYCFTVDEGDCVIPRGIYGKTNNAPFAIIPGCEGTTFAAAPTQTLVTENARFHRVGQYATVATIADFLGKSMPVSPLLGDRPSSWPSLEVSICRMLGWRRFVTSCRVRIASPLTGQTIELSFTALTTSLRGARQQRRLSQTPNDPEYDRNLDGGSISQACRIRTELR